MREYGYSIKGTLATCKRNYLHWGPRYNVVAAAICGIPTK